MESSTAAQAADIIMFGFLMISALVGLICGFTRLILNLCAWTGSVWLAITGSSYIQPFFAQFISHPLGAQIAAASLIFIVVLSLLIYISGSISSSVKQSPMRGLDRSLGLLLGTGFGALILCVLFNFSPMVFSKTVHETLLNDTRLGAFFERGSQVTKQFALKLYTKYQGGESELHDISEKTQQKVKKIAAPFAKKAVDAATDQAQEELTQMIKDELSTPAESLIDSVKP